jgi:glycosyltransferase involved in cell wall biosynthesis
MLVPFLPNTSMSGGQTRWYNLIKYMSKTNEITLFSLIKDESEKKFIPELEKYCKKVRVFRRPKSPWTFRNLFLTAISLYPLLVIRNYSSKEKRAIQEELEKEHYDLIHAEAFYVMPHIPKTNVPSILVEQTIEYMVYKHYVDTKVPLLLKPIYMIDILKLRFWELYFWKKTDQLVAVSDADKGIMQKLIPEIKVDVIPNGVDTAFFTAKKVKKISPPRIMYGVTNFEWLQNREAVEVLINKIWPKVTKKIPNVKLWIVGRLVPDWITKLAKRRDDIIIDESIADARDAYLGATIMVTPIKGSGGTRLKVLEAMAAGLPVVSTSLGVAGLHLQNGKQVLISDTHNGLARETCRLLKDKDLRERIGKEGQLFVKNNYDWKIIVEIQNKIYKNLLSKNA